MSTQSVGQIGLDLKVNNNNLSQQINRSVNGSLRGVNKNVSGSLTSGFKKLGKAVIAAFAVEKVVSFGKACIDLGSDLAEVQNVVDVTFGKNSDTINKWAKTTAKAYGVSELSAKQYSGTMGAMLKSMGITTDASTKMSMNLAGLAGDLASFYNLDTDEAFAKIRSGISGETEPLKQLGINMSVANLEAYALSKGMTKAYKAMSQSEQAILRYNYLLSVTSDAQGDFARTSDGWANQVRVLKLNFDSLKATLGQILINVLLPLVQWLNKVVESANKAAVALGNLFGLNTEPEGIGGLADGATATQEGLEGANSAAQSLKKSLAGFDKLNLLGSSEGENSGSDDGSNTITPDDMASSSVSNGETVKELEATNTVLNKILGKAKALKDIFAGGFKIGFNKSSLKKFMKHIKSVASSVADIFTDDEIKKAANGFLEKFALYLGKVTGSISSMGLTIGEFFVGSVDKYLAKHGPGVKERILSMLNISGEIADVYGDWAVALADLFSIFRSDAAKQVGADIINIFVDPLLTVKETCLKLTRDLFTTITQPFVKNLDGIKKAFSSTLSSISTLTGAISRTVTSLCQSVRDAYDEYIAPAFNNIKEGFTKVVTALTNAYNEHLAPVIDRLSAKFGEMWENHIGPAVQKAITFFGKLGLALSELYNNVIAPVVAWIAEKIAPKIANTIEFIGSVFSTLGSAIGDIVGNIFDSLGGLLDFITGVFSGDWEKAWSGIKAYFKGVWDSFATIVKTPINLIIDAMNYMIRGLNKISFDVPDWVPDWAGGGQTWGINIAEIPKLATGGYVKANTPQLAMIGDNKYEGEIVAPESKITEAVNAAIGPLIEEIRRLVSAVGKGGAGGGQTIKLYVDGKQLFEWFVRQNNSIVRQTGHSPLKT